MKAIIPVAGLGTRMLPATKAIPKEMLTIADKPLIQYIVNELVDAGVNEIILITHSSKNAIENHFDTSFELETTLEKRIKRQLLDEIRNICPKNVTIMHVRQGRAKGLGHAVLCGHALVGDAPCVVILPDMLLPYWQYNGKKDNLAAMIKRFESTGFSQVMVTEVEHNEVSNYGIVDCSGVDLAEQESYKIQDLVEKPEIENAPSNMAVVGRYVFSAAIWDLLKKTPMGVGDEIQLTDAIKSLCEQETVEAFKLKGGYFDCGDKLGYAQAFTEYSANNERFGDEFKQYILSYAKKLQD